MDDVLLIVGDFNARVGSGEVGGDQWDGVHGKNGVGAMNESGEALLSWCSLNGLVVLNTVFEKKRIHKYTWQHPGNKKWHCIDYVIMRQIQRCVCCDVTVLRSADCWTDHKLLRAQLRADIPVKKPRVATKNRFAVSALQDERVCKSFQEKVCRNVENNWGHEKSGTKMWEVIKDGLVSAADNVLGRESRRQPDWFKECGPILEELRNKRNMLFGKWLRSGRNSDRQRYIAQRRLVAGAVKRAKNEWLQEKARIVEVGMLSSGSKGNAWKSMREIQKGRAGLRPTMTRVIRKVSGDGCVGRVESLQNWQDHFRNILNIRSSFSTDVINDVRDCPIDESLAAPPSEDEIIDVLCKMKGNKASGKNGVLPEMIKCCGTELLDYLVELFKKVWQEGCVPQEWKDALIVPIPKKGDLSLCDNWRVSVCWI